MNDTDTRPQTETQLALVPMGSELESVTEQSLLGLLIEQPELIPSCGLTPAMFQRTGNGYVFQAAVDIYERDSALDPIELARTLQGRDQLRWLSETADVGVVYDILESSLPESEFSQLCARIKRSYATRERKRLAGELALCINSEKAQTLIDQLSDIERVSHAGYSPSIPKEIARGVLDSIEERQAFEGIPGVPSGFHDLDLLTCGFQKSDLIIIAARPSMGKSMLVQNIASHIAIEEKRPVFLVSLEMSKQQLVERIYSAHSKIPLSRIRSGGMNPDDWPKLTFACVEFYNSQLLIDDTPALKMSEFRQRCHIVKKQHPELALIIVDYLQLLRPDDSRMKLYEATTEASHTCKEIARELDVPLIALSQLSREIEKRADPKPVLPDLRESGAIEQDADIVAFIHRDNYYDETATDSKAELIIRKHRNGMTGSIKLTYKPSVMTFSNWSQLYG